MARTADPAAPYGYTKAGVPRRRPGRPAVPARHWPGKKEGKSIPPGWVNPDPVTPETRMSKNAPICGAPRRNPASGPGVCCLTAGWGTDHPGVGQCKWHGGALPNVRRKAWMEKIRQKAIILGAPIDIDPHTAVMNEIHRTAGHVAWLHEYIQGISERDGEDAALVQLTSGGMDISAAMKLYQIERAHLVTVSAKAASMGIAERQVQLAEEQGRLIAAVLQKFLTDPELGLTPTQTTAAKAVMRRHLLAIPAASELVTNPALEATPAN